MSSTDFRALIAAFNALDRGPQPRRYAPEPAADVPPPMSDEERERRAQLDLDRRSERPYRSWEDQAADDAGQPRWGEL